MADIEPRRVLVVDDDTRVLRLTVRTLQEAGFEVTAVSSGPDALEELARHRYDVVLSDISMESMTGIELLHNIRASDPNLPVIMMTGGPSMSSSIDALNNGAYRYLVKPVPAKELIASVTRASLLSDLGRLKREAIALEQPGTSGSIALLDAAFSSALAKLFMVFQPIVSVSTGTAFGFEALVRSGEPDLADPTSLFDAAGRLGRQPELSRAIYNAVADRIPDLPENQLLFVNVHPPDLLDPTLHGPGSPLAPHAARIVLEMTERVSLERIGDISPVIADLRSLRYRLAVDDLGTGYAGLSSFTLLSPEFVKLDRSLVTGINAHHTKQRVVRAMFRLCSELRMAVISEGVETKEECRTLVDLGADLIQGYLCGMPSREIDVLPFSL